MSRADITDLSWSNDGNREPHISHLMASGAIWLLPGNMVKLFDQDMLENMLDGIVTIQLPYRYCCTATIGLNS
jgi:hypothetical protein